MSINTKIQQAIKQYFKNKGGVCYEMLERISSEDTSREAQLKLKKHYYCY